jgi:hypothetical protein
MRAIITLILFSWCTTVHSQSGVLNKDTLTVNDSVKFYKGQIITIGKGSKSDGGFAFITTRPDKIGKNVVPSFDLEARWKGYNMKVAGFELVGNDITGKRYYLLLTIDEKSKPRIMADVVNAISSGEIK